MVRSSTDGLSDDCFVECDEWGVMRPCRRCSDPIGEQCLTESTIP